MSTPRDTAAAPAGVSFEVDRFAWADGRLEVSGRWYGIRGRRFLRPTLDVEVDGTSRRMLAVLEHKPWAADDGEEWVAAFEWRGDPVALPVAELAVAPELAVVLPPPSGAPQTKARRAKRGAERLSAAPPRAQALEAELTEARAEAAALRDRLTAEQKAWQQRVEQVEAQHEAAKRAAEAARDEAVAARDEARAARDAAISERDGLASARDAAAAERDKAAAERDAAVAARDAARAEAAKAAAERDSANAERDRATREKTALEHELAAARQARDKARQERNEWLTRARDAEAGRVPAGSESDGEAAPPQHQPAPAKREAPAQPGPPKREAPAPSPPAGRAAEPAHPDAPPGSPAPAAKLPLPTRRGPGRKGATKPNKAQIPPGGILLPPTGPGSHLRRSILPAWAPRVLAPILLLVLIVVIGLLIAWAF
jgi:hypothetical protein